jgi:hypothetical protein
MCRFFSSQTDRLLPDKNKKPWESEVYQAPEWFRAHVKLSASLLTIIFIIILPLGEKNLTYVCPHITK